MVSFGQHLASEGISKRAADLITQCRRAGTISNYESAWRKWVCWCGEQSINPSRSPLNKILNYLAILYDQNLEYRTINVHRSAISAYHDPIEGESVGKHPRVCALMKGIFNTRNPKPKYSFIWDVNKVLEYLRTLGIDLSDKLLTEKLAMLLALSVASRGHELQHLDIRYMTKSNNLITFEFAKLTKSWRNGKPPPAISFKNFDKDPLLCPVKTLELYLEKTKPWREGNKFQLFLGITKPHGEVKACTIARWLKSILRNTGIDTSIFQAHSTRGASSSKVSANLPLSGLSVKDILKRGNWLNYSTWQTFYNRSIVGDNVSYEDLVLDG